MLRVSEKILALRLKEAIPDPQASARGIATYLESAEGQRALARGLRRGELGADDFSQAASLEAAELDKPFTI